MSSSLPAGLSTRGVVDLSTLARSAQTSSGAGSASGAQEGVTELTQGNVQQALIQRSASVPVVLVVWSSADLANSSLVKTMSTLAGQAQGQWELATLDVATQPQLAAAFGVQAVPVVIGVVAGQMVPLFSGAVSEATIRQYLTQLVQLAATQGVGGADDQARAVGEQGASGASVIAPSLPPEVEQAMAALERGDFDAAEQVYLQRLSQQPSDDFARVGVEQVQLLRRVSTLNPAVVLQEAMSKPQDLETALNAADVELTQGRVERAFARLLGFVAVSSGADRERVRTRLVSYFDLLGPDDPRVGKARQQLTSALF